MKQKILVVEDEQDLRLSFDIFLTEAGYEVQVVDSVPAALKAMEREDFDLILTDIILGRDSGLRVLEEAQEKVDRCPVVMITGFPNIESATQALRLGAFDYISKPLRQSELLKTAQVALRFRQAETEKQRLQVLFSGIVESVGDAIITADASGKITYMNQAAKGLCCFLSDPALGQNIADFPLDCEGICLAVMRKALETRKPCELYRQKCDSAGKGEKIFTIQAQPLIGAKSQCQGVVLVVRDETRIHALEETLITQKSYHQLIGDSEPMQHLYALIEKLAQVPSTVLIVGESGTGKELVAEALHFRGPRAQGPFVRVNCAALTENLLESELFGHLKGAFTGATKDRIGRFELAKGGTIFLDEIGDISPKMQLNLLRVLQRKEIERVGSNQSIKVDVRVIAATHQNLVEKIRQGRFREDLFYRLKVVELKVPPLRERKTDIPVLVEYFIRNKSAKFKKKILGVSQEVLAILLNYSWPGNIRELQHAMEHACVLCNGSTIMVENLPEEISNFANVVQPSLSPIQPPEEMASQIRAALVKSGGNKAKAARILGVSRQTLYRRILDLNIKDFE